LGFVCFVCFVCLGYVGGVGCGGFGWVLVCGFVCGWFVGFFVFLLMAQERKFGTLHIIYFEILSLNL